jgi:hypothetical protein
MNRSTRQITRQKIIVYSVIALMVSTAVVYLELGVRGVERMFHFNQSGLVRHHTESNRESYGPRIPGGQTIFFIIVSVAYIVVAAWMLKKRRNSSKIPYIVAVSGSSTIIVQYIISHTVNVPYIGLEAEVNTIDIISKVLQVGIIMGSLIMLRQLKEPQQPKLYT